MVEHKNRKKENPDKEGVKCRCLSRRCGRAGQGRAEPRPGGMGQWEWSKAARHHISNFFFVFVFFFLNQSLHHTTRHWFFSDWEIAGPPEAANRSLNHGEQVG